MLATGLMQVTAVRMDETWYADEVTESSPARLWAARIGWIGIGAFSAMLLTGLTGERRVASLDRIVARTMDLPGVRDRVASAPLRHLGRVWLVVPQPPCACGEDDDSTGVAEPGDVPRVVLPRMPGDNLLREQSAWDEASRAWVITQSLNVPARLALVEKFYRKALAGQGFEADGGALPEDEDAAARSLLRARLPHRHVQVSFRQPRGQLTTRVRVIWRVWPLLESGNG